MARRLDAALPRLVEHLGILARYPGVLEYQDVIGIDVEAGHREIRRAGQHLDGVVLAGDDENLVVGIAAEFAALDGGVPPRCLAEKLLKLVFRFRLAGAVVEGRVVEDM